MIEHLGIPPGTTLFAVITRPEGVELWIMIARGSLQKPRAMWKGTYLMCSIDGSIDRITINPDGSETVIRVKDKRPC